MKAFQKNNSFLRKILTIPSEAFFTKAICVRLFNVGYKTVTSLPQISNLKDMPSFNKQYSSHKLALTELI